MIEPEEGHVYTPSDPIPLPDYDENSGPKGWMFFFIFMFVIVVGAIGGTVLFAINIDSEDLQETDSQIREGRYCGQDMNCFIELVNEEKEGNVTYTATIDVFGFIEQTSTSYMEIERYEEEGVIFYLKYVNGSAEYAEDTPQDLIETAESIYDNLQGIDGRCIIKKDKLIEILRKWKDGNHSPDDWENSECEGKAFEALLIDFD